MTEDQTTQLLEILENISAALDTIAECAEAVLTAMPVDDEKQSERTLRVLNIGRLD
jgi:glutamine amidotransferase PdxT